VTSRKTRILYLTGGRRIGGTETHVCRLAAAIRDDYACLVCCLDSSAEYLALLDEAGVDFVELHLSSLTTPKALGRYLALERIIATFQPDIVHSYSFAGDVLGAMLRARGARVTFLTSRRGEDRSRTHQRVRSIVNRWSDRIVCVSSEVARFVEVAERPAPGLLDVIPNGVPIGVAVGPQPARVPGVLRFGTLGTVKPIKGTDLLVDAFMKFAPDAAVRLSIAGLIDRPWAYDLQARASADGRIEFIGRVSEPNAFLAGLDVFVLPSRSEGMSNALLEAMALGLACVATDVGSNRTVLQPAHRAAGGLICEPSADALFAAMECLARDGEARHRFRVAAREIAERDYATQAMVDKYQHLYSTVVWAHGRPNSRRDAVSAS
jgi:glycosyltransferase involved in cell wall biosynthesis